MSVYIAILRGINVSGHRMIKMDALKELFRDLGFVNPQSYIQSGNVIFEAKKSEPSKLGSKISKAILDQFGFEVPVIVLGLEQLDDVVKRNPYLKEKKKDPAFFHVTFLSEKPDKSVTEKLKADQFLPEEFVLHEQAIYLYCPNGYGNSKLTNSFFESKLKTTATTRNWKTVNKLLELAANC